MKLIEGLCERENTAFPDGKIILLDGSELDCHLLDKAREDDPKVILSRLVFLMESVQLLGIKPVGYFRYNSLAQCHWVAH